MSNADDRKSRSNGGSNRVTDEDGAMFREEPLAFRRFIRRKARHLAPFPRQPHQPERHPDHVTVPGKGELVEDYREALDIITEQMPIRAAVWRDKISRVDAVLERHEAVAREEEERTQNYNEEVARSNEQLQEQIDRLSEERANAAVEWDEQIDALRQRRAKDRAAMEKAAIEAGYAVRDSGGSDEEESAQPPILVPAEHEFAVSGTIQVPPSPIRAPVLTRIKQVVDLFSGIARQKEHARGEPDPPVASDSTSDRAGLVSGVSRTLDAQEEADRRTAPAEAISVELGLPYPAASTTHPVLGFLIEVSFGAIFGVSLALLVRFGDLSLLRFGDSTQVLKFGIAIILGCFIFHVLGERSASLLLLRRTSSIYL